MNPPETPAESSGARTLWPTVLGVVSLLLSLPFLDKGFQLYRFARKLAPYRQDELLATRLEAGFCCLWGAVLVVGGVYLFLRRRFGVSFLLLFALLFPWLPAYRLWKHVSGCELDFFQRSQELCGCFFPSAIRWYLPPVPALLGLIAFSIFLAVWFLRKKTRLEIRDWEM